MAHHVNISSGGHNKTRYPYSGKVMTRFSKTVELPPFYLLFFSGKGTEDMPTLHCFLDPHLGLIQICYTLKTTQLASWCHLSLLLEAHLSIRAGGQVSPYPTHPCSVLRTHRAVVACKHRKSTRNTPIISFTWHFCIPLLDSTDCY